MAETIRVLSTIAMRTVLDAAAPAFERVHGVSVERVLAVCREALADPKTNELQPEL